MDTIADGIATRNVGKDPFGVIEKYVDEVVTVSDSEIAVAVTHLLERAKTLVEGAGAVPLAALLSGAIDYDKDEIIVPVLSGGNIDMNMLTTVIMRGLAHTNRYIKIQTEVKDRPGELRELLEIIADYQANIYAIQHDRTSRDIAMNATEVEIDLETRGAEHVSKLLNALEEADFAVTRLE